MVLPDGFYARPAQLVARDLLGAVIVSTIGGEECRCRIVETEAYTGPADDASHAAARIGRTRRNDVMFGPAGHAYVYRIYGVHWCLNAVTDTPGHPAAVLIRAAEPIAGVRTMEARRGSILKDALLRGPGNLCRGLGITGELDRHPLTAAPLQIIAGDPIADEDVARGPRVGVTRAIDDPLRFWVASHPCVSRRPGGSGREKPDSVLPDSSTRSVPDA